MLDDALGNRRVADDVGDEVGLAGRERAQRSGGLPREGQQESLDLGGAPITAVARRPTPAVSGWKSIATSARETSRVPSQIAWRAEAASVLRASSRVASMTDARSSTWL